MEGMERKPYTDVMLDSMPLITGRRRNPNGLPSNAHSSDMMKVISIGITAARERAFQAVLYPGRA
jgi:hypothetical protein